MRIIVGESLDSAIEAKLIMFGNSRAESLNQNPEDIYIITVRASDSEVIETIEIE
jgi:hypothetical protein